ncbi:phage tail protein [Pseudomonas frederiksbergensis]|uniref:phage tail protein n=1 Tax=Pseudomonas frederiksbergensis TaxID=104087 RepID=UPI003D02CE01
MNVIQELHQFEDGLRPPQPSPAHGWDGDQWVLDVAKRALLEQQDSARLCAKVDAAADRARNALAGDPLRAMEYAQAAADAQAFIDEGYPKKEVPLSVSAWVIKGRTARQAADQIIAKAAQFNESLLTLRTLRLKAKEQIKVHIAKGKTDLANQVSDDAIDAIRKVANELAG